MGQGAARWTLLEGAIHDDNGGQSQQEELRGDGGEKGEAMGVLSLSPKSESESSFIIMAVFDICVSA